MFLVVLFLLKTRAFCGFFMGIGLPKTVFSTAFNLSLLAQIRYSALP